MHFVHEYNKKTAAIAEDISITSRMPLAAHELKEMAAFQLSENKFQFRIPYITNPSRIPLSGKLTEAALLSPKNYLLRQRELSCAHSSGKGNKALYFIPPLSSLSRKLFAAVRLCMVFSAKKAKTQMRFRL